MYILRLEAPRKTPVPKSMVLETRLAAVSATKTTKGTPITVTADTPEDASTATTATAGDVIAAIDVTATTGAPEDVASHDDDALRSRCLQLVCKNGSYPTQDCNVAGIYTGPLPCAASGILGGYKLMVTNTQEPGLRALT